MMRKETQDFADAPSALSRKFGGPAPLPFRGRLRGIYGCDADIRFSPNEL